jgi:hypothetical protein
MFEQLNRSDDLLGVKVVGSFDSSLLFSHQIQVSLIETLHVSTSEKLNKQGTALLGCIYKGNFKHYSPMPIYLYTDLLSEISVHYEDASTLVLIYVSLIFEETDAQLSRGSVAREINADVMVRQLSTEGRRWMGEACVRAIGVTFEFYCC